MGANARYAKWLELQETSNLLFFNKNKIDVSKCDDFDFVKGTMKKQASPKNNKPESSPKTKSKVHHSKNQESPKISHYRSGFICDASHEVLDGNLRKKRWE